MGLLNPQRLRDLDAQCRRVTARRDDLRRQVLALLLEIDACDQDLDGLLGQWFEARS